MQTDLRADAHRLINALATSRASELLTGMKVTQKGGPPVHCLKQIVLSRLFYSQLVTQLVHYKGDTYSCNIGGETTRFRFAVTASRNRPPWFNVTLREFEKLHDTATSLLVIWNPSSSDEWCLQPRLFCLPTDEIHPRLLSNRTILLGSALRATAQKIERESASIPLLREAIYAADPRVFNLPAGDLDETTLSSISSNVEIGLGAAQESTTAMEPNAAARAKHVISKIKERLEAILLFIYTSHIDTSSFLLKHDKTDTTLFEIAGDLTTSLQLEQSEATALSSAYGAGVEIEEDSETTVSIEHPYDPIKTKIDTRPITVDLLVSRIEEDEIDLNPAFQRKAGLWTIKQKSQLIESLLIRIPLPSFYFDATDDSRWLVVDGLQRLVAFKDFIVGNMLLAGLEYLSQLNGKRFDELPRPFTRAIKESQVTIHLIQPGTPPEVKFNIFRRVNTGGLVLTPQEIRHALNQGEVVFLLSELATSAKFLDATTGSIPTDRMADREFVLRFLAFNVTLYTDYKVSDMDAFLSTQMGRLNALTAYYPTYREKFFNAMDRAREIFGKHAFRKLYQPSQSRSPINKALFETWSVHLGNLNEHDARTLVREAALLANASMTLNAEPSFNKSISQGTADVASVRTRFLSVKSLIDTTLAEIRNA